MQKSPFAQDLCNVFLLIIKKTMLFLLLQNISPADMAVMLDRAIENLGEEQFCSIAAKEILTTLRPERILPQSLQRFSPLVTEGLRFFLSSIPAKRLRSIVIEAFSISQTAGINQGLLHLFFQLPTMHKLGQILARNPGIESELKERLIELETRFSNEKSVTYLQKFRNSQPDLMEKTGWQIGEEIIAEASVAAVLPLLFPDGQRGVIKILKPGIEEQLDDELQAMEKTAAFLDEKRQSLDLQDMQVTALFTEIIEGLREEIDLSLEQEKMQEAQKVYQQNSGVRIPILFPGCSSSITAMEYLNGCRITDYAGSVKQKRQLAKRLFEALICTPLFSKYDNSLFHGDPHAGNLLAVPNTRTAVPDIGLIDWTLAGHLSRWQRRTIIQLMIGVETHNTSRIEKAVLRFVKESPPKKSTGLHEKILTITKQSSFQDADPLRKTFLIMEQLTLWGLTFPGELILFRKAFFTLEGVLHDISAEFSMSECMQAYLTDIIAQELPLRSIYGFTPWDSATHYRSMLSNLDLFSLLSNRFYATVTHDFFSTAGQWTWGHPGQRKTSQSILN